MGMFDYKKYVEKFKNLGVIEKFKNLGIIEKFKLFQLFMDNLIKHEPFAFLKAFCLHVRLQISSSCGSIVLFYWGIFHGIWGKFLSAFGTSWEAIKFFAWLTFYLLLWTHGVYIKYLAFKLAFFSAKYLWNFIFSLLDFLFYYFFCDTFIWKLYKYTLKNLHLIVNFFIFNGVPNLVSREIWLERKKRFGLRIRAKALAFYKFLGYAIEEGPASLIKHIYSYHLFFSMKFLDSLKAFKNAINECKLACLRRYRAFLLRYLILRTRYSRRGFIIWKKKFKLRAKFLKRNVKEKTLKYFITLPYIFTSFRFSKLKFHFQSMASPRYALISHRAARSLNFQTNWHRAYILYLKLVRLICFICLKITSFIISIQCFFLAILNQYGKFNKSAEHRKELKNTKILIKELKAWVEKSKKK